MKKLICFILLLPTLALSQTQNIRQPSAFQDTLRAMGKVQFAGGAALDYVWVSDANGIGHWASAAPGSGEVNTSSNVGTGSGWFKQKTGVNFEFKTFISATTDFTITSNTNDLTVDLASNVPRKNTSNAFTAVNTITKSEAFDLFVVLNTNSGANAVAIYGQTSGSSGAGVWGLSGTSSTSYAVRGLSSGGYGGYFRSGTGIPLVANFNGIDMLVVGSTGTTVSGLYVQSVSLATQNAMSVTNSGTGASAAIVGNSSGGAGSMAVWGSSTSTDVGSYGIRGNATAGIGGYFRSNTGKPFVANFNGTDVVSVNSTSLTVATGFINSFSSTGVIALIFNPGVSPFSSALDVVASGTSGFGLRATNLATTSTSYAIQGLATGGFGGYFRSNTGNPLIANFNGTDIFKVTSSGTIIVGSTVVEGGIELGKISVSTGTAKFYHSASSFNVIVSPAALTADRAFQFPNIGTTSTLATVNGGQTFTSATWNGSVIGLTYGGTNANLTASNGGIFYSTATAGAILSGTATAGLGLISGASTTPSWFTPTAGSVLFAGTSGILQQDNTNLFWDDATNRLGIGTATPAVRLDVVGADATLFRPRFSLSSSTTSERVILDFYRSRGTYASPTIVSAGSGGDYIATMRAMAYDGNGYNSIGGWDFAIDGTVTQDVSTPGRFEIYTVPTGSQTEAKRMIINNAGTVTFGSVDGTGAGLVHADIFNAVTGFRIAGGAGSGKMAQGNGTNIILSTPTWPTAGVAAGNSVTDDGTNYSSVNRDDIANLTGDVTTTNTTSTAVTNLLVPMLANETWNFDCTMKVGSSDAVGTVYAVDIPTAATITAWCWGTTSLATAYTQEWVTADNVLTTTVYNTAGLTTAAVGAIIRITGTVVNGANAGNIQIMHAKKTSGTSTVYTGSTINGQRKN